MAFNKKNENARIFVCTKAHPKPGKPGKSAEWSLDSKRALNPFDEGALITIDKKWIVKETRSEVLCTKGNPKYPPVCPKGQDCIGHAWNYIRMCMATSHVHPKAHYEPEEGSSVEFCDTSVAKCEDIGCEFDHLPGPVLASGYFPTYEVLEDGVRVTKTDYSTFIHVTENGEELLQAEKCDWTTDCYNSPMNKCEKVIKDLAKKMYPNSTFCDRGDHGDQGVCTMIASQCIIANRGQQCKKAHPQVRDLNYGGEVLYSFQPERCNIGDACWSQPQPEMVETESPTIAEAQPKKPKFIPGSIPATKEQIKGRKGIRHPDHSDTAEDSSDDVPHTWTTVTKKGKQVQEQVQEQVLEQSLEPIVEEINDADYPSLPQVQYQAPRVQPQYQAQPPVAPPVATPVATQSVTITLPNGMSATLSMADFVQMTAMMQAQQAQ